MFQVRCSLLGWLVICDGSDVVKVGPAHSMTGGCLLKLAARTVARANYTGCSFEQLGASRRLIAMSSMQRVRPGRGCTIAAAHPNADHDDDPSPPTLLT